MLHGLCDPSSTTACTTTQNSGCPQAIVIVIVITVVFVIILAFAMALAFTFASFVVIIIVLIVVTIVFVAAVVAVVVVGVVGVAGASVASGGGDGCPSSGTSNGHIRPSDAPTTASTSTGVTNGSDNLAIGASATSDNYMQRSGLRRDIDVKDHIIGHWVLLSSSSTLFDRIKQQVIVVEKEVREVDRCDSS